MIETIGVSYTYPNGTRALDAVSMAFPKGSISAILGESGSGKTTFLMCLGQFLKPTDGTIMYEGRDIYAIPEPDFRRAIGIVFQKLYLFPHLTVLENLSLAPVHVLGHRRGHARREAIEMLTRLGIEDVAPHYPSEISGGQAQRAAIARALLLKPDYVLLDEPTSALDANTTDDFGEWLTSLRNETNFIIVTHDILFARKTASHGVYLSGGRIQDAGDIAKIIDNVRAGSVVGEGSHEN